MRKFSIALCSLAILISPFTEAKSLCAKPIAVGISEYWPFIFGPSANPKGLDVILLNEISRKTGCQFTYHALPFKRLVRDIKEGKVDLGMAFLKTAERAEFAYFSTPYFIGNDYVYFNKEGESADAIRDVRTLQEMLHFSYAKILGYGYGEETDQLLASMEKEKVRIVDDQKSLLRLAEIKAVDWIILSELEAIEAQRRIAIDDYLERNQRITANKNQWHVMYSRKTVDRQVVAVFDNIIIEFREKLPGFISAL